MTFLKFVFFIMICAPLVYVAVFLFEKIVDNAVDKH